MQSGFLARDVGFSGRETTAARRFELDCGPFGKRITTPEFAAAFLPGEKLMFQTCRLAWWAVAGVFASVLANGPQVFAQNTTIQLPTFSNFSINTVVMAPDAGIMRSGGINRFSARGMRRGIPGLPSNPFTTNRAAGQNAGAAQAAVTTRILILNELEARQTGGYVPAPAFTSRSVPAAPQPAVRRQADFITRNLGGKK